MSGEFIDSNVFLYLFDEAKPRKRQTAEGLIHTALETGTAGVSFQVIQETLDVITRKVETPATPEEVRRFMDQVLVPLWRIMPRRVLYHRTLDIQTRCRYGFYDALIIAAALGAGCTRLHSEDLQHGRQIDGSDHRESV